MTTDRGGVTAARVECCTNAHPGKQDLIIRKLLIPAARRGQKWSII